MKILLHELCMQCSIFSLGKELQGLWSRLSYLLQVTAVKWWIFAGIALSRARWIWKTNFFSFKLRMLHLKVLPYCQLYFHLTCPTQKAGWRMGAVAVLPTEVTAWSPFNLLFFAAGKRLIVFWSSLDSFKWAICNKYLSRRVLNDSMR